MTNMSKKTFYVEHFIIGYLLFYLNLLEVEAIQCFSCKGSGLNEVAANIHCLENGYLENCDDFYEYYSKVEDKKVLTDAYYYDEEDDEYYYDDDFGSDSAYYYENSNEKRQRRDTSGYMKTLQQINSTYNNESGNHIFYGEQRNIYSNDNNFSSNGKLSSNIILDDPSKPLSSNNKKQNAKKKDGKENSVLKESQEKMSLPKDPEHHCYSSTVKVDWEQYHVEKGCKKIDYCRNDIENKPEWTRPWNFCCDKSRCNAKQVKDKPQRIYGMNCRRTDDCIQGHVSRSVCPHLFKSCPKIPPSLIKMECIAKGADPTDVKERYRNPFQEKKCFCTEGNFPKGPVCTSNGYSIHTNIIEIFMLTITTYYMLNSLMLF